MKRAWLALLAVVTLAIAGCSGVPSSSSPETVVVLDTGGPNPTELTPRAGDAREIVTYFLEQNASTTPTHASARAYLTKAASNRWIDDTATIIANEPTISLARHGMVTVFGRVLGTLNSSGIYTPSLQGDGQGGDPQPFVFHLVQQPDGWRIDRLHTGLLLTNEQFRESYRQQVLYFYDLSETSLIPDLRWSALDDRVLWSKWLLEQLADGPRPDLNDAVSTDTMPANIDPSTIAVTLGTPTQIKIPGSSQLDAGVRNRLAAQVSLTLNEALAGREISITDSNGVPVQIPQVGGLSFTATDFAGSTGPPLPTSEVYYLTSGQVRDDAGHLLSGPLGEGQYYLTSFAIGQPEPDGPQYAAGVTGSGDHEQLYVGSVRTGLRPTSVHGALSRPAFAPGRAEAWIGVGSNLVRIEADTDTPRLYPVPIVSGGGRIVALRFSPEGSRIAVVIEGANGGTQLYVGAVVRGAGQVRVDLHEPISPVNVVVTDVAWLDAFKLFAIGYLAGSQDTRSFETGADGTDWTNSTINLPARPDTVTAATASNVWVSAQGHVWKLSGASWVSPGTTGQTSGTAPVYLE